jgi:very-short-patch-repair endonuclease
MPFDIDARIAEWRKSLLDTTKRNRLIKFVAGRVGGVNLVYPAAGDLWTRLVCDDSTLTFAWKRDLLGLPREVVDAESLAADYDPGRGSLGPQAADLARELTERSLRSPRLAPTHLLTEFTDRHLAARLTRLARTAREAETDHGVTTLFAAFGFLRWFEDEGSPEELLAPLLLVPVRLTRETVESEYKLGAEEDDVLPNHCLAELLRSQFRIRWPTDEECALDADDPASLPRYLDAVRERVQHVRRWGVVDSAAVGVFNFQKLAMWEDLGRNAERVKAHPLCRAIAGDSAVGVAAPDGMPAASDLDRVVPAEAAGHILDADSSQHEAIEAVKAGAHVVMDGPPGTGKSQTIANIIAEAVGAGRTVLFVSEKTAALDVVKRRLDRCGLGDFCLELHSHRSNKRQVVAELGRCLDLSPFRPPDVSAQLRQLAQDRQKLNDFVAELHIVRQPLGWSAFRVHGELAQLDRGGPRSRIAIKDVASKDSEFVRRGAEVLAALADCGAILTEPGGHPWRGCKLTTFSHSARDDAEYQVGRLSDVTPPAEKAAAALAALGFAAEPFTVPAWRSGEDDARRVLGARVFPADWFASDAKAVAGALVELDEAAREARSHSDKLPELDPAAVRRIADPESVAAVVPDRERVADARSTGARARVATLGRLESLLRTLAETAAELSATARVIAGLLQVTRTPTADHLGTFAEVAHQVADGPPIPLEWWEARKRDDILESFAHAQQEDRVVSAERERLRERFDDEALDPESLTLVIEAARRSRSFWLRLSPGWWKIRKQVLAWYRKGAPSGRTLRSDTVKLERYHRRSVAVRQVVAQFTSDLILGTDGKPDWVASADRVRAVEWLEHVGVQHTFKAAVGPRRTLNRVALADAARDLARLSRDLHANWTRLLGEFAVPDPSAQLARPAAELAEWFTDEANAVRREADALGVLVSAIAPGKDVAAPVLRDRGLHLRGLVSARARIAAARGVLAEPRSAEELEAADHAATADAARELLSVLAGFRRPITPAVAAAFTQPAVREKLAAAVRQSEAARRPFDKAWERVTTDLFDPDEEVSTSVVLNRLPLAELKKWAADRAADGARLDEWARYARVEREAAEFGLADLVAEVKAGELRPADAADAFRARFYRLWLDALHEQVPALGAFATDTHERTVSRFAETDRYLIRATPERVRGKLLTNPTRPVVREGAPEASELGILLREVNKKRRHLPLRRLFAQIPSILPRVKPCLMMSPLAVSTYLDTPEIDFDLVIFDEASQVRPHDAVCALYRGRQLVVGGDPRQLPPTDFFMRTGEEPDDDGGDDGGTAPFESLLDVCLSLGITRKPLRWHYRSRREALIAFSNRHFYDGSLITFPSASEACGPAVTLRKVPDGRFKDGVNPVEARRVAELVLEHARTRPRNSLGVIAFSQRQQDWILDELELLRRESPGTEPFFAEGRDEPFFVKNLENVQGDERDVILLSVGYGPDESGKVAMRFGPLNRAGGERRLNVAVTRSRLAMTVVSSMTAADVDTARAGSAGARLLKAFLDYAERGPAALADAAPGDSAQADSPFEQAVADELARRGLAVTRRVGLGGYVVDIAITDPQAGGGYLLGVECDGATYRSAHTARDRDRLRRAVLEGLGWRLVRVWSTDWVRDRDRQVRRVLAALEAAREPRRAPSEEIDFERMPAPRRRTSKAVEYESIEKVPAPALAEAVRASLVEFGSMPLDDLAAVAARRLGFKRSGLKIRERVAGAVNELIAAGKLTSGEGDRVRLADTPRP